MTRMQTEEDEFNPDWASPPGDTILDVLRERNRDLLWLAQQLGMPREALIALVSGCATLTDDIASALARELGSTSAFWLAREQQYRQTLGRLKPMEYYECPSCGNTIILEGGRVMHEAPECPTYIRKINEALGKHTPKTVEVPIDRGVAGDRCEAGNECGRIGCETCQK